MAESGDRDVKYWHQKIKNALISDPMLTSEMFKEFPTLESGEPQLRHHVKTLRTLGASLELEAERVKNNDRAQEYRDNGNDLFSSNGDTAKAAEMYTKSLAHALPGSQESALAYANRSAVSFKAEDYEGCLLDIKRSLENNYPEEMTAKLYARRVRCLVVLKKQQSDIEKALQDTRGALLKMDPKANGRNLVEKTLNDKNHMAPTPSKKKKIRMSKPTVPQDDSCDIRGATGITVQYSEKYGRHLIATRDIQPAEIIAVIDAYANARTFANCYRECAHCTKETAVGIPCDHCVNVIYCSSSCRNRAWKDYHNIECPILGILLDLQISTVSLLGMKITLKAVLEAGGVVELKKMVEKIDSVSDPRTKGFTDDVYDCTKYACIYTLTSHTEKHSIQESYYNSLLSTLTMYYLATRTEIFGQKYNADPEVFDKAPLLGFLRELMMKNCWIVQMTGLRGFNGGEDVVLAPLTALCNHSCDSNILSLGRSKSIVFALQPIKKGEQICDNYRSLHFTRVPKAQRQRVLKDHYHFTCDCVACSNDWPMLKKLPDVLDMPGLSPMIQKVLLDAEAVLLEKMGVATAKRDMTRAKNELVQMLELLHEYAYPCQEVIDYRDWLVTMYQSSIDPY